MRSHTRIKKQKHATRSNLVIDSILKIMILGLVLSDAFLGLFNKTPFNFYHFGVQSLHAEKNGQLFLTRNYKLSYSQNRNLLAFQGLLEYLERLNEPVGELRFDRWDYPHGILLYGFNFTAGHTGRGSLALVKHGILNYNIVFGNSSPEGAVVVAIMVFDNVIKVDDNRQVLFDYAP